MVNLGHGQSITAKRLNVNTSLVLIRLHSTYDVHDNYYRPNTIEIILILNNDQLRDFQEALNQCAPLGGLTLVEFSDPADCQCQTWDDFDPETMLTVHHPACKFFDPDELREEEEG